MILPIKLVNSRGYIAGAWKNNKTGAIYYQLSVAINTTNKDNDTPMIVYTDQRQTELYVRERLEFLVKFSPSLVRYEEF